MDTSYSWSSAREAAFATFLCYLREEQFLSETLDRWSRSQKPDPRDLALAREIASGTCRMMRYLEYAINWAAGRPLPLKRKARALLYTAAYQLLFLDRLPSHAVVHESVRLAKKYGHSSLANLVNALLRKLATTPPPLPDSWGVRYSYPDEFVEWMIRQLGKEKALLVLKESNAPPRPMVRLRLAAPPPIGWQRVENTSCPMAVAPRGPLAQDVLLSENYIVQNCTPADLVHDSLISLPSSPKKILDLCAAPGGKSILLHDLFPAADLWVNDPSRARSERLVQNLHRYHVAATLLQQPGEELATETRFDLIVIDAPCSNSGVLHKRPEARWRLTNSAITALQQIQRSLLDHATTLLAPNGRLLYLTCSILEEENEQQTRALSSLEPAGFEKCILPDETGRDGGYGCLLKKAE